jgi:hypothetical protein
VGDTAGSDTTVTVFVDDAVQGRFPSVSAATGRPSDGWLTISTDMARSGRVSIPVLLLCLVGGPIGWAALLAITVLVPDRAEHLTVQVPWSIDTQDRIVALRRRRRIAWTVATLGVVALCASIVVGARDVGGTPMLTQVVAATLAAAAVAAIIDALVTDRRIGRATVQVSLDASRRWVSLHNVHPGFARAVREQPAHAGDARR